MWFLLVCSLACCWVLDLVRNSGIGVDVHGTVFGTEYVLAALSAALNTCI